MDEVRVLLKHIEEPDQNSIEIYEKNGDETSFVTNNDRVLNLLL